MHDALLLELADMLLAYKKAGLIDVNLRQKQRVLDASSSPMILKDYSVHFLTGTPKEGQSLEQVRDLLLEQIAHLKRGEFDEAMLKGIVENLKEDRIRSYETNAGRAYTMLDAFTLGIDWENYAGKIQRMEQVSKQELVDFANRYYGNDYVVVYKRLGEDTTVAKVEKPQITPVDMNRDAQSEFLRGVLAMPTPPITPVFLDYKKDITTLTLKSGLPVHYMRNREDNIFSLYYVLDMGKANDRKLPFALSYLPYLGTGRLSAEKLSREFFKLGCEFGVSSGEDEVYVYLTGLEENFEPGLKLFEEMLAGVKPDKEALGKLVERELKNRSDAKLDKDEILWSGLRNYAVYGPRNPFTDRLSTAELKSLKPEELVDRIHSLLDYRHEILYYGPRTEEGIVAGLNSYHPAPAAFKPYPAATIYPRLDIDKNVVYFVDYDMVQAEILWLRKSSPFQADLVPAASLFNEYYGGNMSGIVFQTIRESRALAYGSYSAYQTPERRSDPFYIVGYIGTQADKLNDAIGAMNDLLTTMPRADKTFSAAREGLKSRLETGRIIRTDALFDYLAARKLGLDHDIRQDTYAKLETMTLDDLARFHDVRYANVPYAYCIIGSREHIKRADLEKYGRVVELKLSDIFGY
jgi:predicted Zn-dependent peptidase